ncbi:zinc finger CCCH domain-containing protein 63-like [Punica granatum]|uniref:Zinc finger CCCH domain-containing protein 63-like n=1 Tax=Punica granatum TaxID=22663 RepID=A0A6P8C3Z0_PUNGR|nr:zinc finger CCCH domain-containing protein 63-like [Punica granatum]
MEVRAARTMPADQRRYRRVGTGSKVCSYWLAGRCTKNACRFLHGELPLQQNAYHGEVKPSSLFKGGGPSKILKGKDGLKRKERLCRHWASGNCVKGDKCLYQHSWSCGHSFGLLAKLEGHKKGIAGIGFPSGSDKLSTGSKDETVKIWDCHTGQCSDTVSVGSEVGSLISEGPWVFVGLQSAVKAWNLECCTAFDLKASSGLVYSMAVGSDLLFAGCQNGDILVWRGSSPTNPLLLVATLKGHTHAVLSLVVGANRLYSASMDRTIRVWDIHTLECITTLKGHANVVMSVLCWDLSVVLLIGQDNKSLGCDLTRRQEPTSCIHAQ